MVWHRGKEQELQQVQRSWSVASQQEGSNSSESQRARQQVKALEGQLRDLHSRLTRLQANTRCPSCCALLPHTHLTMGVVLYVQTLVLGCLTLHAASQSVQRLVQAVDCKTRRCRDSLKYDSFVLASEVAAIVLRSFKTMTVVYHLELSCG